MSGRKRANVHLASGWDGQRFVRDLGAQIDRLKRNAASRLSNIERAAETRERNFQKTVGQLARSQRTLFEGLDQQLAQVRNTLGSLGTELRSEYRAALAQQEEALRNTMEAHFQALSSRIGDMESIQTDARQTAEGLLGAVEAELAYLEGHYLHELFAPGELALLRERAALARQNLSRRCSQSALPLAQESLLQTQRLHVRLELAQQQWEVLRAEALARIDAALDAARQHEQFTLALEGAAASELPKPSPFETDYWSEGTFSALVNELQEKRAVVVCDDMPPNIDVLEDAAKRAEHSMESLGAIVRKAHDAALASVQRADLQAAFYERLREAGYTMEDNAWFGDDERQANHMVMQGLNGEKIAIIVRPNTSDAGVHNEVEVDFQERAPSEIRRRERLDALRAAMAEAYEVPGAWEALPGAEWNRNAPDECFDMARVRKGEAPHAIS